MARPEKKTVDYFPHMTTHGKTLFILQRKFGNDGYAFWFKLLESLGRADYHFLDFNNMVAWEYFIAESLVDEDKAKSILDLIASLDAIDQPCWKNKVVYCQKFCDGVNDAYSRRKNNLPSLKRVYVYINSVHGVLMPTLNGKVKESKGKEIKEEEKGAESQPAQDQETWNSLLENNFPKPTIHQQQLLTLWNKEGKSIDQFKAALEKTSASRGSTRWGWVVDEMKKATIDIAIDVTDEIAKMKRGDYD